jgi:hypothetical protein
LVAVGGVSPWPNDAALGGPPRDRSGHGTYVRDREDHAHVRFRRAIEHRALWAAEDAAREMQHLSLEHLDVLKIAFETKSPVR